METAKRIFNHMLTTCHDYCVDNRGDVGSWVREASMIALEQFSLQLVQHDLTCNAGKLLFVTRFTAD